MWYVYLIVINILGFCLMGIDKKKARNQEWRIAERTLFLTAIVGGSFGIYIGMYSFRHKTKHKSFVVGIPLICLLQIILGYFIMLNS